MKVLQINSVCDFGSTGRTARELADYLQSQGHECYVAYGYRTSTYQNSIRVGSVLENHFHNAFFTRLLGLHGYGTKCGTRKLVRWIEENKPDVIHLRNLHANYLNFPMLFECIIKYNIPVLFTLHDCFNFTGKCAHYTATRCYKWQNECNHCPLFKNTVAPSSFFDNSRRLFRQKKDYYAQMPRMTVVAVSQWLMNEAEKSILSGHGHKVTYVYNWIDRKKFHEASSDDVAAFYSKYHLNPQTKYLVSVSQGWDKNASRYKDAKELAEVLPEGYKLILVGSTIRGTSIPKSVIHIPYIANYYELSSAYTMAEAYVHLSVEDTFGKVIAEAMCCGTIPIAFNSTACGEIAGRYGIVVAPHDISAIVESLPSISILKEKKEEMLRYVRDNFDYQTNAEKYVNLYKELIEG